ncbi:MAG TPA: ABC transporter substrate-binding protein [Polyangiaceae bacterium]|nr:ABC transporter substrate-binding protein [Polyangiaceae bacterium]
MTSRRSFVTAALLSLALSAAPAVWAANPAEEFVKAKQTELMKLVKQGRPDAEVDKVFDQVLDYRILAEAALGEHWADRTDAERQEFTQLLSKLVRNSYRKNLKKTLGYDVTYKGTEKGKDGDVVRTVATSTKDAREEPLSIDYVVRAESAGQRIVDVVTEGSSMVMNYRSSFNRIMKKGGFPEVLKRMRKKADSGSTAAD